MNRLLKNVLLFVFCLIFTFLYACSTNDGADDIQLLSTVPAENAVIPVSTDYITFVFNQSITVADKAKITLNGNSVSDAFTYNETYLRVKINSLVSETNYNLTIDKGAIKDGANNLNKESFSLKFKTKEAAIIGGSVSQNGYLAVNGTSLVNQQGKEVVLHGVSFGWHNWWTRFYNANTVSWLKQDWKCNVVRAAIGVDADGNCYLYKPDAAFNCLYAVIDAAIQNDMYVIVDWHTESIHLDEAKIFFQTVAEKYKNYPNLIYELYNEPNGPSWSAIKAYAEALIQTIRAIAPKNIILVGSPNWDQSLNLPAADPIKGYDNLMYTLHFYAGTHKQSLRDVATAALQKGLPIFVSECGGMGANGDGAIDTQEWQSWLQWMSSNNISWAAWCIADKAESCSMIKDTSSPVSGWTDNDLKQWGQIVRTELRK